MPYVSSVWEKIADLAVGGLTQVGFVPERSLLVLEPGFGQQACQLAGGRRRSGRGGTGTAGLARTLAAGASRSDRDRNLQLADSTRPVDGMLALSRPMRAWP